MLLEAEIMGFDIQCDSCQQENFEITETKRAKYRDGLMYHCQNCGAARTIRKLSIFAGSPNTLAQINM